MMNINTCAEKKERLNLSFFIGSDCQNKKLGLSCGECQVWEKEGETPKETCQIKKVIV